MMRRYFIGGLIAVFLSGGVWAQAPKDDPLIRMPGTQPAPEGNVTLEAPNRCLNCHAGYFSAGEPGHNWQGSMMAHSMRDFLFWACLTVAAQDAMWATGSPNATDICLRCHSPGGWMEGRSDPTNGSAMTGADLDGVHCDFCHRAYDPFFQSTYGGLREGSDWPGYWDETNASSTPSDSAAYATYLEDRWLAQDVLLFNGGPFYDEDNNPFSPNYTENGSGQYFVSSGSEKRASFADAEARHKMLYSRFHKSKFFCSSCHDVSNPVLANLGADPTQPLPTEANAAHSYLHVERTFSEFMLSAYGQQGGSTGLGPFAPQVFQTSDADNKIRMCQDCHMRDIVGRGCNKKGTPVRPDDSTEHPKSGLPMHDLTGGNAWVSYVLASAIPGAPNYDSVNDSLLNQGPAVLTLDLTQGQGVDPVALLDGSDRALQQLQLAASIQNLDYTAETGELCFRIQNQTGHKLISGFPEGRRMFVNIKAYSGGALIAEVNPYDYDVGTLKGLPSPSSPPLGSGETYVDELVYEVHPSSSLTGEHETFHFVLADDRYKDNRIPPKGFRINEAPARVSQPRWHGVDDPGLFTSEEYAGGYDDVALTIASHADLVEVTLYYQTTSREYIEFLRDEINATPGATTLPDGDAYVIQTHPFFNQLRAWGDTIWQLWLHNQDLPGASPVLMAQDTVGAGEPPTPPCDAPDVPQNLVATGGKRKVTLTWEAPSGGPPTGGYNIYYDQSGKTQFVVTVDAGTTSYTDRSLSRNVTYCYTITAWNDCDDNDVFERAVDRESGHTNLACATAQ